MGDILKKLWLFQKTWTLKKTANDNRMLHFGLGKQRNNESILIKNNLLQHSTCLQVSN